MVLFQFEDRIPKVGKDTYTAHSAEVIGDVLIGNNCYIGPGAKIRGDYSSIQIGDRTSIQENCVIHAFFEKSCIIGNDVVVGHGAIIHGSTIKNNVVIGMGAIIGDNTLIKDWCLIGAGAVVRDGQVLEEESLAVGVPAKVVRKISETNKMIIEHSAKIYSQLAPRYIDGLKEIKTE
ncbi:MAG: gamma carbonic anhydrase family protein [Candidatus Hodarchaeales archaeon]